MIEIKITYGTDTAAEAPTLRKLAAALLVLAGDNATTVTVSSAGNDAHVVRNKGTTPAFLPVGGPVQGNGAPGWTIAPNDVPSVGADVARARAEDDGPLVEADPAQVFGAADPDPAQVFGLGNVAALSGTASSPSSVLTGAASTTGSGAGSAAAGETGNVPAVSSPTPSGTPAALTSGAVTGGVNVDSRGLPWDGRIHAGTKTTNKDLTWKKKPNVDPAVVVQVEAELRAIMAIPAPAPNAQPAPIDFAALVPATGAPATPPVVVPPPPPASAPGNVPPSPITPPVSAPTTPVGGGSSITSFAQLLPAVTNAMAAGTLTEQRVADVLAQHGVAVLPQLAPRPDLVQSVAAALFSVQ